MRLIPLPAGVAQDATAADELRERVRLELGCETMLKSWQGQGLLRVSAQIYNRPQEYDRLADGLAALLGSTLGSTLGPTRGSARAPRQGLEPHPHRRHQCERVEVDLATAQPPVQAGRAGTPGMAGEQGGHHLAGGHRPAPGHDRVHRLVRGPQATAVRDADHAPPGHRAGEGDHARAGCPYPCVGSTGQVDAAVSG